MGNVVVTGATSGIGKAIASALIATGHRVMLAGRRVELLEKLIVELGPDAAYEATDVTDQTAVENLIKSATDKFGQVDVLINNAGIMPVSFFSSRKVVEWEKMIDVNLKGVLYGINAVLPQMLGRRDGHIINLSSISGIQATRAFGVYSATKFGVRALSESLRQEMAAGNVRVTTICPGMVETELFGSITDEAVLAIIEKGFDFEPLKPSSIADAIIYAISQPNSVNVSELVIRPTGQA